MEEWERVDTGVEERRKRYWVGGGREKEKEEGEDEERRRMGKWSGEVKLLQMDGGREEKMRQIVHVKWTRGKEKQLWRVNPIVTVKR